MHWARASPCAALPPARARPFVLPLLVESFAPESPDDWSFDPPVVAVAPTLATPGEEAPEHAASVTPSRRIAPVTATSRESRGQRSLAGSLSPLRPFLCALCSMSMMGLSCLRRVSTSYTGEAVSKTL